MSLGALFPNGPTSQGLASAFGSSADLCTRSAITLPEFPTMKVLSLEATPRENYTFFAPQTPGEEHEPWEGLNFCNVTIVYTHPGWHDEVVVTTFLPTEDWNGRFMANGGGGFLTCGDTTLHFTMVPGLERGFAVSTTDGGHRQGGYLDPSPWAFASPGNVNLPLLTDFASLALHDMSVIGKAVVNAFYGKPPNHSYFYGSSTGGRQGHMIAQRHPEDFDGIIAIMPAMNWNRFIWSSVWPPFVMDALQFYPRPCEIDAITEAAMRRCDGLDGAEDGIISRLDLCDFDPNSLIGTEFDCNGETAKITTGGATIAKATFDGPRSAAGQFQWFGFTPGTNISQFGIGPAVTECDGEKCDAVPFQITHNWAKYFLAKNADFDMRRISHETWDELRRKSINEYESIMGSADADLSGLRKAGSKLLNWHGTIDNAIPVNGSVEYYERVLDLDPKAHDYYRFFVAPGAAHCLACGLVPDPMGLMDIMVAWTEEGIAPETLPVAGDNKDGTRLERDICMYPRVQHYVGGDYTKPSSFTCV